MHTPPKSPLPGPASRRVGAYGLWALGGLLGAHRFYLGRIWTGGAQLGLAAICFPMAQIAYTADTTAGVSLTLLLQTLIGAYGGLALLIWIAADLALIPGMAKGRKAERAAMRRLLWLQDAKRRWAAMRGAATAPQRREARAAG